MRKIIAIIVLIILGVSFYFYMDRNVEKNKSNKGSSTHLIEENILSQAQKDYEGLLEQVRKFQENPDQIAEFNCMLTKVIYSGKLKDEDIRLLLKLQREYFTPATLEKNPEDVNADRLIDELKSYKEADLHIIGYKIIGPQYVDVKAGEKPILIFNVILYTNYTSEGGEVYKGYVYEQNDKKLWELKGFGQVDDFPIIN